MSDTRWLDPEAAFLRALRLVGREVSLRERARTIEMDPARMWEAAWLFRRAQLLRRTRLELLVRAGVLESSEPWTR